MKKVLALTAGVLVALAPTGTAFAGETGPVPGKAYGNCKHSSAGGNPHTGLLAPAYNKGNGGLVELGKAGLGCVPATPPATSQPAPPDTKVVEDVTDEEPTDETEPGTSPGYDVGPR